MTDLLQAQDLRFGYRPEDRLVLDGATLSVPMGSITGLVGPNGAGKSSLIKAIVGPEALAAPLQSGTITLKGVDLSHARSRARAIAYVPQHLPLAEGLSVGQIVALGRFPHSSFFGFDADDNDRAVILKAMETCGVLTMRDRALSTLSGGERQRVYLASALAQEPQLLLLDEPTSALDLHHSLHLFDLLAERVKDGKHAVLLATHDLILAARRCHRIAVLHQGRICAEGPPADVLTKDLLRDVYGIEARIIADPDSGAPLVLPTRAIGGPP